MGKIQKQNLADKHLIPSMSISCEPPKLHLFILILFQISEQYFFKSLQLASFESVSELQTWEGLYFEAYDLYTCDWGRQRSFSNIIYVCLSPTPTSNIQRSFCFYLRMLRLKMCPHAWFYLILIYKISQWTQS